MIPVSSALIFCWSIRLELRHGRGPVSVPATCAVPSGFRHKFPALEPFERRAPRNSNKPSRSRALAPDPDCATAPAERRLINGDTPRIECFILGRELSATKPGAWL